MVRCFVGFLIPEHLRKSISEVKDELSKLEMKCKFVEDENLHICFSFLGEVEEEKIDYISKNLDSICNSYAGFEVFIDGVKPIPSENYIRVIALDVVDSNRVLKSIAKEIQERIGGDSKPPHLTLCRVKNITNKQEMKKKIQELRQKKIGNMKITSVQLIKSELQRGGPLYSAIHESKLMEQTP